ncbi:MAG TPA: protein kinase [Gemmataceae bacterium]|nr:protein kinase [Gemmataceae bacterium]
MIAFSCAHCGMKFSVKPEFAGRSTRCPTCKQPLVVPQEATVANPPPSRIDGPLSSLARAGVAADVTVGWQRATDKDSVARPVAEVLASRNAEGQRYLLEGELARGGMGAVLRAVDCDIRREVAVKYLLDQSDTRKKTRFVEEAQITGQLEHPNIVPIHELGVDTKGRLFFSMKMVRGRSLQQVLQELRDVPRVAEKEYGLGRLLTIFVNICHALAYAHTRGVVHRDLKPANIMLGDFGEVYVMDWGLAKVLARAVPVAQLATVIQTAPSFAWAEAEKSGTSSATVQTDRSAEDDKTMDGTVMGTALYMPPEQAMGNIAAIDPRSDIYSLGAILYEMLSLQPPVDKSGGFHAILRRVSQGEIVPPEQRAPERVRKIPPELSAVALKALAKDKKDRYQTVEALRRDIELYLEGRSVSAKEDTHRELFLKLLKRNKGVSAATAAALVLLAVVVAWSSWVNYKARRETEKALTAYQGAQHEKEERTRNAVPALVKAARLAVDRRQYDDALTQVKLALDYDPDHAEARLLKGQLLIVSNDFAAAVTELERHVRQRPKDAEARHLLALCRREKPAEVSNLLRLAEAFERAKVPALADGLLRGHGATSFEARTKLLELYRQRIESAWPGLGNRLTLDDAGIYRLDLQECKQVSALDALEGMPLTSLILHGCGQVRDLSPLKGMPLTWLSLHGCGQVRDLSPLKGMPLTSLNLGGGSQVADLSPLKGMRLTYLNLGGYGHVADLSPLKGMPLTSLELGGCSQVADLSPLKGMRLTWLSLYGCGHVADLSPLKGMPLTYLHLDGCGQVRDLSPLAGMNLSELGSPLEVDRGMDALRRMKALGKINGMPAAEFWKKYDAGEFKQYKP